MDPSRLPRSKKGLPHSSAAYRSSKGPLVNPDSASPSTRPCEQSTIQKQTRPPESKPPNDLLPLLCYYSSCAFSAFSAFSSLRKTSFFFETHELVFHGIYRRLKMRGNSGTRSILLLCGCSQRAETNRESVFGFWVAARDDGTRVPRLSDFPSPAVGALSLSLASRLSGVASSKKPRNFHPRGPQLS